MLLSRTAPPCTPKGKMVPLGEYIADAADFGNEIAKLLNGGFLALGHHFDTALFFDVSLELAKGCARTFD